MARQPVKPEEFQLDEQRMEEIQQRKKKKKKRKIKVKHPVILAVTILAIGYFSFHILKQEYVYWQLSEKKIQLEKELSSEKLKGEQMDEELKSSASRSYIEYLAKKYLGLIYPGEKVYVPVEGDRDSEQGN